MDSTRLIINIPKESFTREEKEAYDSFIEKLLAIIEKYNREGTEKKHRNIGI